MPNPPPGRSTDCNDDQDPIATVIGSGIKPRIKQPDAVFDDPVPLRRYYPPCALWCWHVCQHNIPDRGHLPRDVNKNPYHFLKNKENGRQPNHGHGVRHLVDFLYTP